MHSGRLRSTTAKKNNPLSIPSANMLIEFCQNLDQERERQKKRKRKERKKREREREREKENGSDFWFPRNS